jgi:arylformamidase
LKKLLIMSLLIGAAGVSAQNSERLSPDCRRELIRLCYATAGLDRRAIASCALEKRDQISVACKAELWKRAEQKLGGRPTGTPGATEYAYGSDPKQRFDFWPALKSGNKSPPLMVFVHGGGWSIGDKSSGTGAKPAFYQGLGYAFASINYRLVPQVRPGDQARDLASALAFMRKDAVRLGFDPEHIVLMGHSAGAHLVALVSADTRFLDQAGIPVTSIKGSILLDGAAYDVAKQMAEKTNKVPGMYSAAFGSDPAVQKELSPISYVKGPNSPDWLFLYDAERAASQSQSKALATKLSANGAKVKVLAVTNSSHMAINRDAGAAGNFVGDAISAFLKSAEG